jgi:GR25 family glycosyltransferase involved in LPS biosynthesis/glycosyltransferase involved in cell wall biosynthesis
MMNTPKRIGLNMIVKNERALIRRCLDSVRPLLDYVLIEDTGSTDGTQQIIRDWLAEHDLPGEVVEAPWRDFASNRSHALACLRTRPEIDYALIIDADDVLEIVDGFDAARFKAGLDADFYHLRVRQNATHHARPQLVSNHKPFRFRGVLHEYLEVPDGAGHSDTAEGLTIRASIEGARSADPDKYRHDAVLLELALAEETDPFLRTRYMFYLAQSYRDCGETARSEAAYLQRAEMGYWDEEVYVSWLEAGYRQAELGRPFETVMASFKRAMATVPHRLEAPYAAAHYCRAQSRNRDGYEVAQAALPAQNSAIPDGLFILRWIYEYGLLDELAINAYWAGEYAASVRANLRILAHPNLPEDQRARILQNAANAAARLPQPAELGSNASPDLVTQHALIPARNLHSRCDAPRVMIAILAKQKAPALPLYLDCIAALDYPKSAITLYIRTNNNTDETELLLRDWVAKIGAHYAAVIFDAENVAAPVERFASHEWNAERFSVLGKIRNESLAQARAAGCAFYFVADCDNFIRPGTLRELVALNLPIVAPLLRTIDPTRFYSNYHAEIDAQGYFQNCDQYQWILNRWIRGVLEVPVVHCTYLVRTDVSAALSYEDDTGRYEYVVFSDSARRAGIPQYIDNRQVYGYITFDAGHAEHVENGYARARELLQIDADMRPAAAMPAAEAALRQCYVINLEDSPGRLENFRQRHPALGPVERFAAIDGKRADRDRLVAEGVILPDLDYRPGTLGCALSHVALWRRAAEADAPVTIFEDDACCAANFRPAAARILAELPPDWDIVQWGFIYDVSFLWLDYGFAKAELRPYDDAYRGDRAAFCRTQVTPQAVRLAHSFGLMAYSLSPKGARRLLAEVLPLRKRFIPFPGTGIVCEDEGIDIAMCGAYGALQAYATIPPLAIHSELEPSDRIARN